MSLLGHPSYLFLALPLFVLISLDFTQQAQFEGSVITKFTVVTAEDQHPAKDFIKDLGVPARRTKCAAATKSEACAEYKCKVVFGSPGKVLPYEFEYEKEKDGKKTVKKWGVKCASKPVIFLTAGKEGTQASDENYEVMIIKEAQQA